MTAETAKPHILVTGATGFIGRELCKILQERGFRVRAAVKNETPDLPVKCQITVVGDVGPETDWQVALEGIDTVIHLAGRAHVLKDIDASVYRNVNVLGTERLAAMAAQANVKRFIFMSSVKVNGEGSSKAYTETDTPAPRDAYAISKLEAENALARITATTGMQTVVLRPPLVYGPGVKANFKNLIKIAGSGLPLPLKHIDNKRSFIYLGNLVSALLTCATHPFATSETFMVSDAEDISTEDLIRMIAAAMGRKLYLFALHPGILRTICSLAGMRQDMKKMTGTLIVDTSKIRDMLGWKPPFSLGEGITETMKHYKS